MVRYGVTVLRSSTVAALPSETAKKTEGLREIRNEPNPLLAWRLIRELPAIIVRLRYLLTYEPVVVRQHPYLSLLAATTSHTSFSNHARKLADNGRI